MRARESQAEEEHARAIGADAGMSLFGSESDTDGDEHEQEPRQLKREVPVGLYHLERIISAAVQTDLALALSTRVFTSAANQSMLFCSPTSGFPAFLSTVVESLPSLLRSHLPAELYSTLFDSESPRQAIFNLYRPGEGITSHVDLLSRFEDGVIGLSLASSTMLDFTREGYEPYSIVLRPGDIYILSAEARYEWQHGIASRAYDVIDGFKVKRRLRMSVTLRRMKEGANVVGANDDEG